MMNQSQFLAITCNSLKAREKSRVHGAIGFGFASHWLKNWHGSFKPITGCSNRNHVITFNGHLKTALIEFKLEKKESKVIILQFTLNLISSLFIYLFSKKGKMELQTGLCFYYVFGVRTH